MSGLREFELAFGPAPSCYTVAYSVFVASSEFHEAPTGFNRSTIQDRSCCDLLLDAWFELRRLGGAMLPRTSQDLVIKRLSWV